MTTDVITGRTGALTDQAYGRFAGVCALASAAGAIIYSVAFVITKSPAVYALALLLGGLISAVVMLAVYRLVRAAGGPFAQLGLVFAMAGAVGAFAHGAFDLANAAHPEYSPSGVFKNVSPDALASLPSQLDPRGALTFGLAGLGLAALAYLALRGRSLPPGLAALGIVLGVVMMYLFVARLTILDANALALKGPAALAGIVLSPLWSLWLGVTLVRSPRR